MIEQRVPHGTLFVLMSATISVYCYVWQQIGVDYLIAVLFGAIVLVVLIMMLLT
jgi:hypothetical protein